MKRLITKCDRCGLSPPRNIGNRPTHMQRLSLVGGGNHLCWKCLRVFQRCVLGAVLIVYNPCRGILRHFVGLSAWVAEQKEIAG